MKGASDRELIKYAKENNRVILTRDDDFRELGEQKQAGIILQTKRQTKEQTSSGVIKVLNSISSSQLKNEIVYIPWR